MPEYRSGVSGSRPIRPTGNSSRSLEGDRRGVCRPATDYRWLGLAFPRCARARHRAGPSTVSRKDSAVDVPPNGSSGRLSYEHSMATDRHQTPSSVRHLVGVSSQNGCRPLRGHSRSRRGRGMHPAGRIRRRTGSPNWVAEQAETSRRRAVQENTLGSLIPGSADLPPHDRICSRCQSDDLELGE